MVVNKRRGATVALCRATRRSAGPAKPPCTYALLAPSPPGCVPCCCCGGAGEAAAFLRCISASSASMLMLAKKGLGGGAALAGALLLPSLALLVLPAAPQVSAGG